MIHGKCSQSLIRVCLLLAVALTLVVPASAEWKEKVLYSFQGVPDGAVPTGAVVFDKAGNLYGATLDGGASTCDGPGQCGTVYKLAPPATKGGAWTETVLYIFKGHAQNDGATPEGGLVTDEAGNLYGTTGYGGSGPCLLLGGAVGCGTVYEISPPAKQDDPWTETVLYSFQGGKDGYVASGDLVFDKAGNLYGATLFGGGKGTTCDSLYGGQCGTVFKLSPPKTKGGNWTEKLLHAFAGATDGANPNGGLLLDSKGAIYGTTVWGGSTACQGPGCGTVFGLKPPKKGGGAWTEEMIHRFIDGNDGAGPNGDLIFDAKGALYGTAGGGGPASGGVVFRFAKRANTWGQTVLHAFSGSGNAPCCPLAGLVFDDSGNLYGVSLSGTYFRGTVFRLHAPRTSTDGWIFDLLYTMEGVPDSAYPEAGLIFGKAGGPYGTTQGGGTGTCSGGCGTVFEVSP
jgi:uncharacterized repeat protein (TIGR03803 family)